MARNPHRAAATRILALSLVSAPPSLVFLDRFLSIPDALVHLFDGFLQLFDDLRLEMLLRSLLLNGVPQGILGLDQLFHGLNEVLGNRCLGLVDCLALVFLLVFLLVLGFLFVLALGLGRAGP